MILDWQTFGLLDYPDPQGGLGRGRGSKKALYSAHQRSLFQALLQHRSTTKRIRQLTVIPVYLWLYWGEQYVPLRQAKLAFATYLGATTRASRDRAEQAARQLTEQLAHPAARDTDRTKLRRLLGDAMWAGSGLSPQLQEVLQRVFDPAGEGRTLGPPGATLTAAAFTTAAMAKAAVVRLVERDELPDAAYLTARITAQHTMQEYLRRQPELAQHAGELSSLFQPLTDQDLVMNSCRNLLEVLAWQHHDLNENQPAAGPGS